MTLQNCNLSLLDFLIYEENLVLFFISVLSAFSTTMFAFAGAPNFPTIQSDMKDRRQFFTAVIFAMASKDIYLSS
jgi:amino acid permease